MTAVLITGATRGIGRAVSERLRADGHEVVGIARRPDPTFPGRLVCCDLESVAETAEALAEITGVAAISGVVNNAGMSIRGRVGQIALEDLARVLDLNVRSVLQIVQAVLPSMLERRFGRIVNISSRAMLGMEDYSTLAAANGAVAAMSKCWALELAGKGITVNTLALGPIDTELFWRVREPGDPKTADYIGSIPVKRLGQPDEVAAAVSLFMSDVAGFTTGQILYVCGGLTLGKASAI